MSKIREFFGFPKETYEWDEQDTKLIFISIFFYMGIAAIPFILRSEESISGNKLTAITLLMFSLYSFIIFIAISIRINKKSK